MRHRLYGGVRGSLCKGALYSIIFHDVIGKASKADATIIGLKLPSETIKPQKTFYRVRSSNCVKPERIIFQ